MQRQGPSNAPAIFGSDYRQCDVCRHLLERGNQLGQNWTCAAFPTAIPHLILDHDHDHRHPYPGDQGIRYQPADPAFDPWAEDDTL